MILPSFHEPTPWLFLFCCYLIGTIPFGLIFTWLAGMGDVRAIGSGNIGATNVLRTGNKKLAALTLLGDVLKGTITLILSKILFPHLEIISLLAGLLAFLGHIFPLWLGFKGGKGVATYLGVCLGLSWLSAIAFALSWISIALITRYSSLSALIAIFIVPIFVYIYSHNIPASLTLALMGCIIIVKHKSNIIRLWQGQEPKIGAKNNEKRGQNPQ
ncbi:glycerol-3-phosphate 1-O-acyltransferase PlsY [Bartonella sp. DGB2]|uniref:glycerol-3-phosphate 1-O-acyltransferase PlsY n=1 Tax=Bartonella sp. DGB2 TaxID=3388426 RepID=UPI00398FF2F3